MHREVLITGGAGFIGSTIASACIDDGITPVLLDDLSTGVPQFTNDRPFYRGDIADHELLRAVIAEHPTIDVVVHCAARIVVPESVADPLGYYDVNVAKTIAMLMTLLELGVSKIVFSSSASVYGTPPEPVVDEATPIAPSSPYARSKAMVEDVLRDASFADQVRAVSLRYFNPIGADPRYRSGLQHGEPGHALGKLIHSAETGTPFPITGTDYPTRDGTGLRDYVHVWDIARAHVLAIRHFADATNNEPYRVINLGTGRGTTVRELVAAFEQVVGASVQAHPAPRRPGDTPGCYTRTDRAAELLGWQAELSLEAGISDSLRWAEIRQARLLAD
jgi:UDP-glucose 4-epimerase